MIMNPYAVEEKKPVAKAGKIVLLRRKELGNNCHYIADNFPGKKLAIVQPNEVPADVEWVVRWGTTTEIANKKAKVINKSSAIHETVNKGAFRMKAAKAGLTARTWLSVADLGKEENVEKVIVRPLTHERSIGLYLCTNLAELQAAVKKCGGEGKYYISDYIAKTQEFRVFVASGRAFMVFEKQPKNKNEISWGCVEEGALKYVKWSQWDEAVVKNAIAAFNLSSLDFGAVDVMVKDGKAYFLEINTAPEVWQYYGECFGLVLSYMINKGRERIPVELNKGWKGLIHPVMPEHAGR
jgi:glutathione synthase/RimK-type ligase-like ATP-grasp enzyme